MYPRSWFSVLLFFSPGLEARMLSQMVSETQEPIFPPASRKSLGRNSAGSRTIWYRPLKVAVQKPSMLMIYRRFRQRSIGSPASIYNDFLSADLFSNATQPTWMKRGILFGAAATLCGRLTATWLS